MYKETQQEQEQELDEAMSANGGLRSHFGRWWDSMRGRAEEEGEELEEESVPVSASTSRVTQDSSAVSHPSRHNSTFRVAAIKGSITLTQVTNFGDTQKVADRLKAGEPQIVNLEKTGPEVAERLVDFLNGVTYALDGYVEKVADNAYLFTPSHIAIHADTVEQQAQNKPFFDRL